MLMTTPTRDVWAANIAIEWLPVQMYMMHCPEIESENKIWHDQISWFGPFCTLI